MGSFIKWLKDILITSVKIVVLVNILLILQKTLSETGILQWLEKPFYPLMKLMGLPVKSSFLWIIANVIGLSYGGAVMISQSVEGGLSREDADLVNHHIAVSHSQLEDTLLFVAVGMPVAWLMLPRFVLAIVVVWLRRVELIIKKT
jgi:spore maturation protein SpmB